MKWLKLIIPVIIFMIIVGCGGKTVETDTPEPIATTAPVAETQTVEVDGYILSIEKDGEDLIEKLDGEEVVAEGALNIAADVEGNFEATVELSDGSAVQIKLHVDEDGIVDEASVSDLESGKLFGGSYDGDGSNKSTYMSIFEFEDIEGNEFISCGMSDGTRLACWENSKVRNVEKGLIEINSIVQPNIVVSTIELASNLFVYVSGAYGELILINRNFNLKELNLSGLDHDGAGSILFRCAEKGKCVAEDALPFNADGDDRDYIEIDDIICMVEEASKGDLIQCQKDVPFGI